MNSRGQKYQGKPCRHGHLGVRYVLGHQCVECAQDHAREFMRRKRERVAVSTGQSVTSAA